MDISRIFSFGIFIRTWSKFLEQVEYDARYFIEGCIIVCISFIQVF